MNSGSSFSVEKNIKTREPSWVLFLVSSHVEGEGKTFYVTRAIFRGHG